MRQIEVIKNHIYADRIEKIENTRFLINKNRIYLIYNKKIQNLIEGNKKN